MFKSKISDASGKKRYNLGALESVSRYNLGALEIVSRYNLGALEIVSTTVKRYNLGALEIVSFFLPEASLFLDLNIENKHKNE